MIALLNAMMGRAVDFSYVRWTSLGDSITAANQYQPIVKNNLGIATSTVLGYSGYPITEVVANCIVNMYGNIPATDPDLITVFAGTNDWQNESPLGTPTSSDSTNFYGAVNELITGVKSQNTAAKLFFILTPQRYHYVGALDGFELINGQGLQLKDYNNAIKNRCIAYGVKYLDLYDHPLLPYSGIVQPPTTTAWSDDGIHPNTYGYSIVGGLIANFLRNNY